MVSKNNTLIGFRFPVKYLGALDTLAREQRLTRAVLSRSILTWALDKSQGLSPILKIPLIYDKVARDRAKLSGKSIVISVRLPHEQAEAIRDASVRYGNNVSEWCALALLRSIRPI